MNKKLVMSVFVMLLGFGQVINGNDLPTRRRADAATAKELSPKEKMQQKKEEAKKRVEARQAKLQEQTVDLRGHTAESTAEASSVLERMQQKHGSVSKETPKPRKETKSGWKFFSYKTPDVEE